MRTLRSLLYVCLVTGLACQDSDAEDDGADGTNGPGSAGGDGDGDGTGTWRPFSSDSPWNTPIPADAALEPDSDALIQHLSTSSEWAFLGINIKEWSIPVYWADEGTPLVDVDVIRVAGEGFGTDPRAPIPDGAQPDPKSDAHMCVVDKKARKEWGFFSTNSEGGSWTCAVCATSDLNGTGVRPPGDGNQDWTLSHGARACGYPLMAGLITVEEMQAGGIDHALAIAYPGIRSKWYTPPASTSQATFDAISPDAGVPCGGRIQLDPTLDLSTLGLSESGMIVATALQKYGAFVSDYSGAISLYADGSPQAQAVWDAGLLDTFEVRDKVDLLDFRVLEIGELWDGDNR